MPCPDYKDNCPHADESAERAVKKVFAILGVDIEDPHEVEEFRKDLRFGASLRRASDRGMLVFATSIAAGIAYAVWYGIVHSVSGR